MVEMWFRYNQEHSNKTLTCAYWNTTEDKWRTDGVSLIGRNQTHTGYGFFIKQYFINKTIYRALS